MWFGPDDGDAYSTARDELISRFEQYPGGHGLGWVATEVLDFKWGYLGGDLMRWDVDEVADILLDLYPAKVMLDGEDVDWVINGFTAFVRFLAAEGVFSVAHADGLATAINGMAGDFRSAVMDESNWSMGKRLWNQARIEGVDLSEEGELERFTEAFNARPFQERDAILGGATQGQGSSLGGILLGPLPPVELAPTEELEEAARASVTYQRIRLLVDYVGDGIALTDRGNLKLADGKMLVDLLETDDRFDEKIGDRVFKTKSTADLSGIDLTYRLALVTRVLTQKGKRLVPGANVEFTNDPLGLHYGAWLGFLNEIGPTQYHYRDHVYGWDWYAEDLDSSLPPILVDLYRRGEAEIEEITASIWRHLNSLYDLDDVPPENLDFHRRLIDGSLRRAFRLLTTLGTVQVADVTETTTEHGFTDENGGTVRLTPLGKWAVQRFASKITSAPIVGALRESTASDLLAAVSDMAETEAIGEIEAWVNHHGDKSAGSLVEALPDADETGRGLALGALIEIGPRAAGAVETLSGHPELAPYLTIWRCETLGADATRIEGAGDPEAFVRLLATVIELTGPTGAARVWADRAAGPDGMLAMLDRVWRLDLSGTESVLAAIGTEYPDKTIAKAARTALFKYQSSRR